MQINTNNRGITLVTLVITIIILIIISTITINAVWGENGLWRQAQVTKESSENTIQSEIEKTDNISQVYANKMSEITEFELPAMWYDDESGNVTNGKVTLAIGDYVNYDCTTSNASYTSYESNNGYGDQIFTASEYQYSLRVLGADEETGELLIVSEDLVPLEGGYTNTTSNRDFYRLVDKEGYANGMNEYGNSFYWFDKNYGWQSSPYTTSASSSSRKEITTLLGDRYTYFPNTLNKNSSGTTVGIEKNNQAYKMLFTNSSTGANPNSAGETDDFKYWLGSLYTDIDTFITFGIRVISSGYVSTRSIMFSTGLVASDATYFGVRPVVSISSDLSIVDSGTDRDGCTLWNLSI